MERDENHHDFRPIHVSEVGMRRWVLITGCSTGIGRALVGACRQRGWGVVATARRLAECYHRTKRPAWQWFESRMTYANAVLPHALFVAARCWPEEDFLDAAEASFAFLDSETTVNDIFWPIGNSDWYPHGEEKSRYDQQPVEAGTMAEAALAAFGLLGDEKYLAMFRRARAWFHGQNSLSRSLVDVQSGACCDGLQPAGM